MSGATMGACHYCEFDCVEIKSEHRDLDKKIKETINQIDKLKSEKNRMRNKENEIKTADNSWHYRLRLAKSRDRNCKDEATELGWKLSSLQEVLDKLCCANNLYRRTRYAPKGEQDNLTLHFRMQHGTKNLSNERKLARESIARKKREDVGYQRLSSLKEFDNEINRAYTHWCWYRKKKDKKQYEDLMSQREEAIVNAVVKGKFWDSLGNKQEILEQIKVTKKKLDGIHKKQDEYYEKIDIAYKKIDYLERRMSNLQKKSLDIDREFNRVQQSLIQLRLKEFHIEQCLEKRCSCSERK